MITSDPLRGNMITVKIFNPESNDRGTYVFPFRFWKEELQFLAQRGYVVEEGR